MRDLLHSCWQRGSLCSFWDALGEDIVGTLAVIRKPAVIKKTRSRANAKAATSFQFSGARKCASAIPLRSHHDSWNFSLVQNVPIPL
jgi:hypothetical protein